MDNRPNFDKLLDVAPFACVLMGDNFNVQYMNAVMRKYLDIDLDDNVGVASLLQHLHQEDHQDFLEFLNKMDKPPQEQTWKVFRFTSNAGDDKYILLNGTNNLDEFGQSGVFLLVGMPLMDTNLEALVPEHIQQSLVDKFGYNKFRNIFESATVGIAILNRDGVFEEVNPTFSELLGLTRDNILNSHFREVLEGQGREELASLIEEIDQNRLSMIKDIIPVSIGDKNHRIMETTISHVYNNFDNLDKYMLISEDITEQEDTQTALMQSEKLALTGRLAASLAHEINNPLQTSLGCLGLVEEMLDEEQDNDLRTYIELAIEELERSARIVKKLRDLNRMADPEDLEPLDLREMIEGVMLLTKNHLFHHNVVPIFPYQGQPPVVTASRDQIQQVFLNLFMNAIDAMPDGGNIYLDIVPTVDPRGYHIKIRDTGIGIESEDAENLFSPFFTTKEEGLGLGLFICKNIIENHNGTLDFESVPGKGTEFKIWLPCTNQSDCKELE